MSFLCINISYLATFGCILTAACQCLGGGGEILIAAGTRPQNAVQRFIHTLWCMKVSYIATKLLEAPIVANNALLQPADEAAQPSTRIPTPKSWFGSLDQCHCARSVSQHIFEAWFTKNKSRRLIWNVRENSLFGISLLSVFFFVCTVFFLCLQLLFSPANIFAWTIFLFINSSFDVAIFSFFWYKICFFILSSAVPHSLCGI